MRLPSIGICLVLQVLAANAYNDYYWRDYKGKIPPDAVPGGKDGNGKQTYVGQTYLHNVGVFVMQIFPGVSNSDVAAWGIKKPSAIIKILCSKYLDKFYWATTTSKTFHLETTGKHAVIGGYDHLDANKGMLHVGRLYFQGGLKIGSVSGYTLENAMLHFVGGNVEQKANNYEVLMFDVSDQDDASQNSSACTYLFTY